MSLISESQFAEFGSIAQLGNRLLMPANLPPVLCFVWKTNFDSCIWKSNFRSKPLRDGS